MAKIEYKDLIKHPKWQKKRLKILERDDFTCKICGDKETELHVHHKSYKGNPWDAEDSELETICKHCHLLVHEYRNTMFFDLTVSKEILFKNFVYYLVALDKNINHYVFKDGFSTPGLLTITPIKMIKDFIIRL